MNARGLGAGLTLAMYIRAGARLDSGLLVFLSDHQVSQFAPQRLTNKIQMLQVYPFCDLMVQVIDRRRSNACCPCKVSL